MSGDDLVVGAAGNLSARGGSLVTTAPSGLPYQEVHPDLVIVVGYATDRQVEGPFRSASELSLYLAALRATRRTLVVHTRSYAATTVTSLEGIDVFPIIHCYICMFGNNDV